MTSINNIQELISMMESRFGWFGRFLSGAMLLIVPLGIISWCLHLIFTFFVSPLATAIMSSSDAITLRTLISWGITSATLIITCSLSYAFAHYILNPKLERRMETASQRIKEEFKRMETASQQVKEELKRLEQLRAYLLVTTDDGQPRDKGYEEVLRNIEELARKTE